MFAALIYSACGSDNSSSSDGNKESIAQQACEDMVNALVKVRVACLSEDQATARSEVLFQMRTSAPNGCEDAISLSDEEEFYQRCLLTKTLLKNAHRITQ